MARADKASGIQDLGASGAIEAVYVCGDVVMTEGLRTIRADEMYYDFVGKKGMAINATMRSFDVGRGIPIYVRAAKVRRLAEDKFAAENVVLTTSEFAVPQISTRASSVLVTDTTTIDQQAGQAQRQLLRRPDARRSAQSRGDDDILLALCAKQSRKAGRSLQELACRA